MALVVVVSILGQRRLEKNKQKSVSSVKGDELPIWPFEPMPIMTDTEVLFFAKLQQAVPEYHIFSQVQLSRIIQPSDDAGSDRAFWLNRICRQSVDYVLVARDGQTTLLAIELDDWTHDSPSRVRADEKKDKALASAGIPILRFHAERMPSVDIIRHDIQAVLRQYGGG
ncbi:DUF2726 domain-containing protein [Psychrobacter lutiphocae]|uniref:DUF2726 domain-containing protein n=1 Tax=Psychrobacter lutiphocae TaxID=540500 RepID=UPI0003A6E0E4|nr:DUF2726 domain-containing protein [Psychrobacter lutiphocae]